MEQCVCNAKVAILVNGEPTNWIKTKRGVRQGDPLSPFLFLLVAECLAKMTNVATANNLLKGIGPSNESRTTLVQFADDTFLFCEARKKYMKNLRLMWSLFEWASGMKINKEKSELYYMGQTEGRATTLANLVECKVGTLPTTYLGFPLSPRPPTKAVWTEIIQKIQRKIEGWQAKLLSRGGRLILVNAVLTNLPLYFLSVFKAPKWVTKRIEALRRDFFWNGESNSLGKGCLVAWKSVCLSKIQGGLGILDIAIMNQALLIKWWWRFHTEPQLQWTKIIRAMYYRRRKPLREGKSFSPYSYWWKGVVNTGVLFHWGISHSLGNGNSIDFWTDRWCGDTCLHLAFPEIYALTEHNLVKVKDCFNSQGWNWTRMWSDELIIRSGLGAKLSVLRDRVTGYYVTQGADTIRWRWSTDGIFSVKSAYTMLNDRGMRDRRANKIWTLRIPLKIKVFCWLVLKKRLLTADNLAKRGWTGNMTCMLCGSHDETVNHLLAQCVFTKFILVMGVENIQATELGDDVIHIWDRLMVKKGLQNTRHSLPELAACWWTMWKARNDLIFRNIQLDPLVTVYRLKELLKS